MKKAKLLLKILASAIPAFLFSGCKPDINELTFDANGLDFSRYVAVGSASTAGYTDGALFNEGQENSIAAILAKQFKYVGGGEFKQPLFSSDIGYGLNGQAKLKLSNKVFCTGNSGLSAENVSVAGDASINNYMGGTPFNNMAVPGMKSFQMQSQDFGNPDILISGNPFYSRFASQPGQSTVLADAKNQSPTFFTFRLGSEDVMGYALAGGDAAIGAITPDSVFKSSIENAVSTLAAAQTKGAIANISDIADIPFFTVIPYSPLVLTQDEADSLNALYALLNPAIQFTEGNNALVMEDAAAPGQKRQVKSTEYILYSLPVDSILCGGWGSNTLKPLADKYVLDATEINAIKGAVSRFNTILKNVATQYDLVFVDVNAYIKSIKPGVVFNGVTYSPSYLSGSVFSIDLTNLSPKGNALVANEFIKAINLKHGSRIPLADVNAYKGIIFP